ncbi:MAG: cytochrome c [Bryobacterales bacterium]|nr:cytochrome c [Bryobacterales bacterium]
MRRCGSLLSAVAIGSCAGLLAHDPITTRITYSREIIRIFEKRCFSCHKEGGAAPMSLTKYEDARPWAKAIKEEVLERRMPPWGAVKGFGAFRNEEALSQEEVSLIADWVEGGAPEGELKYYPLKISTDGPPPVNLEGNRLLVKDTVKVPGAVRLIGLEAAAPTDLASVHIVAEQPDGSVEPLIWLRNFKAGWKRQFEFREPIALAAGSKIRVEPPTQASFAIFLRAD